MRRFNKLLRYVCLLRVSLPEYGILVIIYLLKKNSSSDETLSTNLFPLNLHLNSYPCTYPISYRERKGRRAAYP